MERSVGLIVLMSIICSIPWFVLPAKVMRAQCHHQPQLFAYMPPRVTMTMMTEHSRRLIFVIAEARDHPPAVAARASLGMRRPPMMRPMMRPMARTGCRCELRVIASLPACLPASCAGPSSETIESMVRRLHWLFSFTPIPPEGHPAFAGGLASSLSLQKSNTARASTSTTANRPGSCKHTHMGNRYVFSHHCLERGFPNRKEQFGVLFLRVPPSLLVSKGNKRENTSFGGSTTEDTPKLQQITGISFWAPTLLSLHL